MKLNLQVSVGEAVDKLSILDIKLNKIKCGKKINEIQKERDMIYDTIKHIIQLYPHLYRWLIYINTYIWDIQNIVRQSQSGLHKFAESIQTFNDMRFRVKNKLNYLTDSDYKEQKGYESAVGLLITHQGLGDLINMNGAIRFYSTVVDHLFVVCPHNNMSNINDMLKDDPSIELISIKDNEDISSNYTNLKIGDTLRSKSLTHIFKCGVHNNIYNFYELPNCFYDQLNLPREIKNIFFHMNTQEDILDIPAITPYIFCHSTSSTTTEDNFVKWDLNLVFTIDPNTNHYPKEHKWFSEAEKYLNKSILKYTKVIENASELHLTNSSFQCLACYLNLNSSVRICYDRDTGLVDEYMSSCLFKN